jgi:indolepyruvate ferredoxin oxidoreductase alpha subunit
LSPANPSLSQSLAERFQSPLRGDHALGLGALAAGVSLVTGYPGSPATPVFDAIMGASAPEQCKLHWAANEKVALEMAIGASLAGQRALVVLKSVGLNVALDPLATFSLSGGFGGLVILLGDDPGGWGSQNEQDTRWLCRTAEVPLVEPTRAEQAANLMVQAFAWSERHGLPIIVRITNSLGSERTMVQPPWLLPPAPGIFPRKRDRWVVLPATVVKRHNTLHRRLAELARAMETSPYDTVAGDGATGILSVGHTLGRVRQVLRREQQVSILSLSSVWPLPEESLLRWLGERQRVLVVEEGGAFVEGQVRSLVQRHSLPTTVLGQETRTLPAEGELTASSLASALNLLAPELGLAPQGEAHRSMPSRVPLCEGCGYIPLFEALIAAMEQHGGRAAHIMVGETGCMVRANLPPMRLFDVKYGLGSGLGMGLGLAVAGARQRVVCLIGDSSFFHSGINALPSLVQSGADLTVVILDNGVTALTGGQVHPGTSHDERGSARPGESIEAVLRAAGVDPQVVSPNRPEEMRSALDGALAGRGLNVLVAQVPCVRYIQEDKSA